MASSNEDEVPRGYAYAWSKDSAEKPLDEFLKQYRPSMVQDDGRKPWIWAVRAAGPAFPTNLLDCISGAQDVVDNTVTRVEEIQNDSDIPLRANKKKGLRSKKEVREETQAAATKELKDISLKYGYGTGKWLMFAPSDKVDVIWTNLARSLISGPLSSTDAFSAKVSTCPKEEVPHYQHVICLYMPNVYDKDSVTKIMRVLLRNHGMNLTGVKPDLYTYIGIKSKHPSGIPSTVQKPGDLMKDSEIKELKEAFYEEMKNPPPAASSADQGVPEAKLGKPQNKAKTAAKPKLIKKNAMSDPFGDSEDEGDKKKDSDEDEDMKPAKNATKARKRARSKSDSGDESEQPTRRRIKGKK
ncbi:hypothetical protein CYLTODRAFT_294619 [Cylindrobasidium torrendii FP15055 ss-10]|uniref:DUF1917-domain-containing protein n=1 Tax=Cylindrobasidium torrendii FP15055 ss-10 TaxID=1314674 RepID=A0A0D7B9W5_9AGAR|nr:hypothetical protein CYLTODRAFT_294619 [Cylindrobasidium torrendii FP15055 ss-10]